MMPLDHRWMSVRFISLSAPLFLRETAMIFSTCLVFSIHLFDPRCWVVFDWPKKDMESIHSMHFVAPRLEHEILNESFCREVPHLVRSHQLLVASPYYHFDLLHKPLTCAHYELTRVESYSIKSVRLGTNFKVSFWKVVWRDTNPRHNEQFLDYTPTFDYLWSGLTP